MTRMGGCRIGSGILSYILTARPDEGAGRRSFRSFGVWNARMVGGRVIVVRRRKTGISGYRFCGREIDRRADGSVRSAIGAEPGKTVPDFARAGRLSAPDTGRRGRARMTDRT